MPHTSTLSHKQDLTSVHRIVSTKLSCCIWKKSCATVKELRCASRHVTLAIFSRDKVIARKIAGVTSVLVHLLIFLCEIKDSWA